MEEGGKGTKVTYMGEKVRAVKNVRYCSLQNMNEQVHYHLEILVGF